MLDHKGLTHEAIAHYRRALHLEPDSLKAHNNLGATLFSEALQINPKDSEAQQNLQKVRELMKRNGALRSDARHSNKEPNQVNSSVAQQINNVPLFYNKSTTSPYFIRQVLQLKLKLH